MQNMVIQNMPFKVGQTVAIAGNNTPNAANFSVNIGHNDENYAFHLNPRFDACGQRNTIVCNSLEKGCWKEEVFPGGFVTLRKCPFCLFQIIIKLTCGGFLITLPDGFQFTFPNRLHADEYSYFCFVGDVSIRSFEIY
uniref:Galectin n=1 Tax=Oryzias sinensis TaxID=183150 RepID=A0A8C7WTI9_9TELE